MKHSVSFDIYDTPNHTTFVPSGLMLYPSDFKGMPLNGYLSDTLATGELVKYVYYIHVPKDYIHADFMDALKEFIVSAEFAEAVRARGAIHDALFEGSQPDVPPAKQRTPLEIQIVQPTIHPIPYCRVGLPPL